MFFVFNLLLNGLLYKLCSEAAFEGVNIIFIKKKICIFIYGKPAFFFVLDISKKKLHKFLYTDNRIIFVISKKIYMFISRKISYLFVSLKNCIYFEEIIKISLISFGGIITQLYCKIFSILDYSV